MQFLFGIGRRNTGVIRTVTVVISHFEAIVSPQPLPGNVVLGILCAFRRKGLERKKEIVGSHVQNAVGAAEIISEGCVGCYVSLCTGEVPP